MEKYQEWKWYDTIAIIVLIIGLIICLIIGDYMVAIVCLLLILMIIATFKKEIYLKLAKNALNNENVDKATEYCDKVLKNKPNYLYGLLRKGEIYEYLNKNNEALRIYDQIIEMYPESPIPWKMKGKLYENTNNKSKANESYETASKLKLAHDEKKLSYKIMKKLMFKK